MLACVVAIPAVALWGTSWSDVVKRIEDFRLPQQCLDFLSASSSTSSDDPSHSTTPGAVTATTESSAPGPLASAVQGTGDTRSIAATPLKPVAAAPSAVVPIGYQASTGASPVVAPVTDAAGQGAGGAGAADQFRAIQERLRQLGATYYLLESWGNQQQLYRFYCKMAVGGSAQYTRCFEATHADALQSMVQVLRQVETWRSGGPTKAESSD
jgi:hypothetical protein